MAEMRDMTTSTTLTALVESCEPSQSINQIVNYARNGTAYIQIIGSPKTTYDVICYVTRSVLATVETAWHNGDTIKIEVHHGTYYGIITEFQKSIISGYNPYVSGDYFKLELKLAKVTYSS